MTKFLTIFRSFSTLYENSPKLVEGHTNVAEHFTKFSEDSRRFPKIAEDFRGRPEYVYIHTYIQTYIQTLFSSQKGFSENTKRKKKLYICFDHTPTNLSFSETNLISVKSSISSLVIRHPSPGCGFL